MPGVSCMKAMITRTKMRIITEVKMPMFKLYHVGGCNSSTNLLACGL